MAFNKGRTKTGGRTKGTPNRRTNEIKIIIDRLCSAISRKDIDTLISECSPAVLLNFISKIAPKDLYENTSSEGAKNIVFIESSEKAALKNFFNRNSHLLPLEVLPDDR